MAANLTVAELLSQLDGILKGMDEDTLIEHLNSLRSLLHIYSPFKGEPIENVQWLPCGRLEANDYNPNVMAPQESALLTRSLELDGFTHPLVVRRSEEGPSFIIVDGFHRHDLCQKRASLRRRFKGHVPVVIQQDSDLQGMMASTVRHNRARGQHKIQAMSELVRELSLSGWGDARIASELGMEQDEVLRLKQLNGLLEMFRDRSFSQAWTT
jgi:ParB-like chromosome segregation protein Spo0J